MPHGNQRAKIYGRHTKEKKKKPKHTTTGNHQITKEGNTRNRETIRHQETMSKWQEVHTYQHLFPHKWTKFSNKETQSRGTWVA